MPKVNGSYLVEFPEALIFTSAIILECCMQLGLIPTNTNYAKLFRSFSISAQITDQSGAPVYSSASSAPLSAEQLALESGSRIGEHTVIRKMTLPGGFGYWQDDMSELDRLNRELSEYYLSIDDTVRRKEILQAKMNIHDEMNRLMLSTVATDSEDTAALDAIFSLWEKNALLLCMESERKAAGHEKSSIEALAKALGLRLIWHDDLPSELSGSQQELLFFTAQ